MHIDPANRLVADSLEADWNAKLRDSPSKSSRDTSTSPAPAQDNPITGPAR